MSQDRLIFAKPPKEQPGTEAEVAQERLYSERRAQRLFLQQLFIFRRLVAQYWARGGVLSTKDATIALMGELHKINHEGDPMNFELISLLQQRAREEVAALDAQQKYHFELYKDHWEALQKEQGEVIDG